MARLRVVEGRLIHLCGGSVVPRRSMARTDCAAWGEIMKDRPRDSYILATKAWGQMSDDPADSGLSATQIAEQIDAALARAGVSHR